MKIAGSGVIGAGEYNEEISVCGSGKINGNISCNEFKCSGAVKAVGDIISCGDLKVSGTMRVGKNIKAANVKISGACTAEGDVVASGEITVSGNLKASGVIKASKIVAGGTVSAASGMEAEEIKIAGRIQSSGLINAEKVEIKLEHAENKIFGIGGSEINIYPGKTAAFVNNIPLLTKIVGCNIGTLEIEDGIEGDTVKVAYIKCPSITGRVVEIGACCEIECVKYSDSISVDPEAIVGRCEKI